jgi:hypothetical protein
MEGPVDKLTGLLVVLGSAVLCALTVAYVAHFAFGLTRIEIRIDAILSAAVLAIAVLLLQRKTMN